MEKLKLTRFCGEEYYPVKEAVWRYFEGDKEEDEPDQLCLDISMEAGENLSEDTAGLNASPSWEVNYSGSFDKNDIRQGFKAHFLDSLDEAYEEELTNFYYCEHEPSWNNTIEVLDKDENGRLRIRLTGEITDVNYYDGSKPSNKIYLETWFAPR